jgi:hypothetical protein
MLTIKSQYPSAGHEHRFDPAANPELALRERMSEYT